MEASWPDNGWSNGVGINEVGKRAYKVNLHIARKRGISERVL